MPVQFLSEADRARLTRFPAEIAPDDLVAFFTLSESDLVQVQAHRGDANRLGFSLQIAALRYLGFCPDDLSSAPASAVAYLAHQLGTVPDVLNAYGARAHTRTDHQQEVQTYLGFQRASVRTRTHGYGCKR